MPGMVETDDVRTSPIRTKTFLEPLPIIIGLVTGIVAFVLSGAAAYMAEDPGLRLGGIALTVLTVIGVLAVVAFRGNAGIALGATVLLLMLIFNLVGVNPEQLPNGFLAVLTLGATSVLTAAVAACGLGAGWLAWGSRRAALIDPTTRV
jgi:hypothetical protein